MIVQYKTSHYEPLYTLTEAEKIIDCNRNKAVKRDKAERVYYIKQKLCGLVMFAVGIASPFLLDGDATFSLIAVPMGIGLIITKQKVMTFLEVKK